jgi:hypothetical protein
VPVQGYVKEMLQLISLISGGMWNAINGIAIYVTSIGEPKSKENQILKKGQRDSSLILLCLSSAPIFLFCSFILRQILF